jgi:potassium-dependent mechanosensitive channel
MSKSNKLLILLLIIAILGMAGSFITKRFILSTDEVVTLAVVGPMSGKDAQIGLAMKQGAEIFAKGINEKDGIHRRKVILDFFDDKDDPVEAKKIAEKIVGQKNIIAVIGHWGHKASLAAIPVYKKNKIPLITFARGSEGAVKDSPWLYKISFNDANQAKFLANYTRNVLKKKIVTIVHEGNELGNILAENYEKTYNRFGTKIRFKFSFQPGEGREKVFKEVVDTLKAKKDMGIIYLAMTATEAAHFVKYARDNKIKNQMVGPDTIGTNAFYRKIKEITDVENIEKYTNKIFLTTPLLWDTSGQAGQAFNSRFISENNNEADWIAACANDAVRIAVQGLIKEEDASSSINFDDSRKIVKNYLASLTSIKSGIRGVLGRIYFNSDGEVVSTVQLGQFDGNKIVSALTQLKPIIKKGGYVNYFNEVKEGRMLYVNNRFMYKTNVVYTGIVIDKVLDLNMEDHSAEIEFSIWFRYRGKFDPAEIEFLNSIEPIELDEPYEETKIKQRDLNFKLYKTSGRFHLDFSNAKKSYGSHELGFIFKHKTLNFNNLVYVVDVLGVGLKPDETYLDKVKTSNILNPALGWGMDSAWFASETVLLNSMGRPQYVGYGTVKPRFSTINLGIMVSKEEFSIGDFVDSDYFIYLGIFGFIGILFALGIDINAKGLFWTVSSFCMYCFFGPLFLMAMGNIVLDYSCNNLPVAYVDLIVLGYSCIWWLMGAKFVSLAVNRFVWVPVEARAQRVVPGVIRIFATFSIYLGAYLGILAFVLGQTLTSMLATGGLLTMVIGLAIQANIANIFSGIVVNLERPFSVGDWVRFGSLDDCQILDITWRTVRVRTFDGDTICIPNAKASESSIINHSIGEGNRTKVKVMVSPDYTSKEIIRHLKKVTKKVPGISDLKPVRVVYKGVEDVSHHWVGVYEVWIWREDFADATHTVLFWQEVDKYFHEVGISFDAACSSLASGKDYNRQLALDKLSINDSKRIEDKTNDQEMNDQGKIKYDQDDNSDESNFGDDLI